MMLHPDPSSVVIDDLADVTVVAFAGDAVRLDVELTAVVDKHLLRLVQETGRHQLLLNFGNIVYLSSVGLGMLIRLQKQLEGVGGCFVLCNVTPELYPVFETTHLTGLLTISLSEPAADPSAGNGAPGPVVERWDLRAGLQLLRATAASRGEPHKKTLWKRPSPTASPEAKPNPAPLAG